MTLRISASRISFIFLFCITLFTSCDEDAVSDDTMSNNNMDDPNNTQEENLVIGDWTAFSNNCNGLNCDGLIYRFQQNGTVMIGRLFQNSHFLYNQFAPEYSYSSAAKFYYKSTWSIIGEELHIDGIINFDNNISDLDEDLSLTLKTDIDFTETSFYTSFQKNNTVEADYEKIIDLTNVTIGQTSLSGFWIGSNNLTGLQLNNGQLNGVFQYDSNTGTFVDVSDQQSSGIGSPKYLFDSQGQGHVINREYTELFYGVIAGPTSSDHKILDFGADENGIINLIISRTSFGTSALFRRN